MFEVCMLVVNVYYVSICMIGFSGQYVFCVYGIFCELKVFGKYFVVLCVFGVGVCLYLGSKDFVVCGVIMFDIGIYGILVNFVFGFYDQMCIGVFNGYYFYNFDNKDFYYYCCVYLSCVCVNDFFILCEMYDG